MSFVSYAQNFEDVMLWRAFKSIKNGFYIDIGAQDPIIDSVSLAFYQHGWRGVHVEPTPKYFAKLKKARPDEVVEQIAIGNSSGSLKFYEFPNTGLSTADPEIAKKHQEEGYEPIEIQVSTLTLDLLLDQYGIGDVHWLKIDVEGFEKLVIESWHSSIVRPWILVIESTKPGTQDPNHDEWESLVFNKGYSFAYFDGLNRFYVHSDHIDLLRFFTFPPNVFDAFKLGGKASHSFCDEVLAEVKNAQLISEDWKNKLEITYRSKSWKITKPLRLIGGVIRIAKAKLKNITKYL